MNLEHYVASFQIKISSLIHFKKQNILINIRSVRLKIKQNELFGMSIMLQVVKDYNNEYS